MPANASATTDDGVAGAASAGNTPKSGFAGSPSSGDSPRGDDNSASDQSLRAPTRREASVGRAAPTNPAATQATATAVADSEPASAAPPPGLGTGATATGPLGTAQPSVLGSAPVASGSPLGAAGPATAVEATIRLAHAQGFSRARLSLKPAELGGVEIVLHRSGEGFAAALVADTPEAARLLEAGGEDLRRRLAAHGVELGAFSVSVAADDAAPGREGAPGSPSAGAGTTSRTSPATGDGAGTTTAQTIDLGGGVLVDVLA
jgi:flagellar hook-length control protein FliK